MVSRLTSFLGNSLSVSDALSATVDMAAPMMSAPPNLAELEALDYGRRPRPPRTITSSFLDCEFPERPHGGNGPHGGVTVHHTSYIVVYPAACSTKEWLATYTVVESCPKKCGPRHPKNHHWIPPNFTVTTVTCDVCHHKTQTITCPNALGTEAAIIEGDGITVSIAAEPTPAGAVPTPPEAAPAMENSMPMAVETPGAIPDVPGGGDEVYGTAPDVPGGGTEVYGAAPGVPGEGAEVYGAAPIAPIPSGDFNPASIFDPAGNPIGNNFPSNDPAVPPNRVAPVITASAPRTIGLKGGLALLTGISVALLSF